MEQEDTSVEVTLKDEKTLNFVYKTSLQRAAQIIAFLTAIDNQPTTRGQLGEHGIGRATTGRTSGSPLEAVRLSEAKTYPQKIATLGEFIVARDGRDTFDPSEVLTLLKRMGDMPRNYGRDLRNAELLGYIQKEPNGEYYLTSLGSEQVQAQFANAISASSSRKRRARKSADKKRNNDNK